MSLDIIKQHRGISLHTLNECGVRWDEHNTSHPVVFPYRNLHGEWYERRGVDPSQHPAIQPKIKSPSNSKPHLYNPLRIGPNSSFVVMCEGEYDTLSVIEAGYPAVGTQGTGTFQAPWVRLFTGAVTIVMFDSDSPGVTAAMKFKKWHTEAGGTSYVKRGDPEIDLNDLLISGDLEEYIEEFLYDQEIEYEREAT